VAYDFQETRFMIDQESFKAKYSLTCAHEDSWAFVNHKARHIVIRLFQDQFKELVYTPEWREGNDAEAIEFFKYLHLVEHQGYGVKTVPVKGYWDPYKRRFTLSGYHEKTLFDARLEIDQTGTVRWFPYSPKLPLFQRLLKSVSPENSGNKDQYAPLQTDDDTAPTDNAVAKPANRSVSLATLEEAGTTFKYDWTVGASKADLFAIAFQAKWHDFDDHQRLFLGNQHIATYIRSTGVIFANFREDIMDDVIKFYGKT
jgi:hypothetical protein